QRVASALRHRKPRRCFPFSAMSLMSQMSQPLYSQAAATASDPQGSLSAPRLRVQHEAIRVTYFDKARPMLLDQDLDRRVPTFFFTERGRSEAKDVARLDRVLRLT